MPLSVKINKVTKTRSATFDFKQIEFGHTATDHMLVAHYRNRKWEQPKIEPFRALQLSPMAAGLHYGQLVFEGMKAYRLPSGDINVFRLQKHGERFNQSLQRMCMPSIPASFFRQCIHAFVATEQDWVSSIPGNTLYLRPFVIATEPRLGVKVAEEYSFILIAAPMSAYYAGNIKVKVETQFVRAAEGGAGYAKHAGNYGAAFYPTQQAMAEGFGQVIWTDAKEHRFIEESGTMNVIFIIDGIVVTPPVSGTILDGITRDSLLTLAKKAGIPVEERPISLQELEEAFERGKKIEAYGVGTAAVVTPMELISINGKQYFPDLSDTALQQLRKELNDIRTGQVPDPYGWNDIIGINHFVPQSL